VKNHLIEDPLETTDPIPFEQAMAELEEIVQRLETGTLSLEETVALYQRGRFLTQHCQGLLDGAELRVRQLIRDGEGAGQTAPFHTEEA